MANESPLQVAREARQATELLEKDVLQLKDDLDSVDIARLRERIVTLETTVAELKRTKEELEKRHWQFVYIFAGAMASLLVTVVVQLLIHLLKR